MPVKEINEPDADADRSYIIDKQGYELSGSNITSIIRTITSINAVCKFLLPVNTLTNHDMFRHCEP